MISIVVGGILSAMFESLKTHITDWNKLLTYLSDHIWENKIPA